MVSEIQNQWKEIGDTKIYSTGHYVAKKQEVRAIFQCDIFDNGENLLRAENNNVITSRLNTDKRIVFNFFPLKDGERYIIEGIAPERVLEESKDLLPDKLKEILVARRRVRYN